jgi:hypothetical protein
MTVHWSNSPRKHEFKTPAEFAALSDADRARYILSLVMQIRFMAAKLERYKAKVRQLEKADAALMAEREARQR